VLDLSIIDQFFSLRYRETKQQRNGNLTMNCKIYNISQEFYATCQLLEVDPKDVLANTAFSHLTTTRPILNVTVNQLGEIFQNIVVLYGKDDFHIKLADGFSKAAFGSPFLALQCSENLHDGMYRVGKFKELIEPVIWQITEDNGTLTIGLESASPDFAPVGIMQIMSFLWLTKSCRNVSAKAIHPISVFITDEVPYQSEIEKELGCCVNIANHAAITFALSDLTHAVLSVNHAVTIGLDIAITKSTCNKTISNHASYDENYFIPAVYRAVADLLPSGVITRERVANRVGLGRRTFERRLSELNLSFTDVVRDCRKKMAGHYLQDTLIPIPEISLLLGYCELNSFYRAFKSWFGFTPQTLRNESER